MTEDVKKIYNDMADSYDSSFSGGIWILYDALTWKYIEDYLPEGKCTILDAGGGTGKWALELARRGYTVYLTDLSSEMLKKAEKKIDENLSGKVIILESDVCTMEFSDNFFDFVLCEGDPVSYCCENHFQALQELVRVAKPHSIIEVGVDSRLSFMTGFVRRPHEEGLKAFEKGLSMDMWKTPTFTFTPRILEEEFNRCGADLLKIVGKPILWSMLAHHIENLKERIENDIEFREKLIRFEIALNEEGFGPSGLHLQAIARKR